MRMCNFKHASTKKILSGDWSPFSPDYYPFAEVDDFCSPCYRWRFLSIIRGSFPRWGNLLSNPNNPSEEFPQYFNVAKNYRKFSTALIRALSRSSHPNSIIRNIPQPNLLLDYLSGGIDIEAHHIFAMNLIGIWLDRLNDEGVLDEYISTDQTLINFFILINYSIGNYIDIYQFFKSYKV